jgi:DNA-binding beta-propeller fold protein YncE
MVSLIALRSSVDTPKSSAMLGIGARNGFHRAMLFRRILLLMGVLTLTACARATASTYPDAVPLDPLPPVSTTATAGDPPLATRTPTTTTTLPPTSELTLVEVDVIGGDIAPKSVIATGHGLFFAQNMMYRHTVTVYNEDRELVATIPDTVTLSDDGSGTSTYQGAPVEAVATSDGAYVYVSNYQMYGPGYGNAGNDTCEPGAWDDSFVYRIATDDMSIDQVIAVGAVPKYVALTPDDGTLLVTNGAASICP